MPLFITAPAMPPPLVPHAARICPINHIGQGPRDSCQWRRCVLQETGPCRSDRACISTLLCRVALGRCASAVKVLLFVRAASPLFGVMVAQKMPRRQITRRRQSDPAALANAPLKEQLCPAFIAPSSLKDSLGTSKSSAQHLPSLVQGAAYREARNAGVAASKEALSVASQRCVAPSLSSMGSPTARVSGLDLSGSTASRALQ